MATLSGLPPGPRLPVPLQMLRYGLDPYGFFESAHRAFGDVFTARAMGETWVVLAHPDAVRELYTYAPDEADSGVANMALRPLLGTRNVLLLDGQEHLRRRKLVLPPFQRGGRSPARTRGLSGHGPRSGRAGESDSVQRRLAATGSGRG